MMSNFYCLQCGQKGIPLPRNRGRQREKFHRKRMYCPHCKIDVNHIEVKTSMEAQEFKRNYNKGVYQLEAKESIAFVRKEKERTHGLCLL